MRKINQENIRVKTSKITTQDRTYEFNLIVSSLLGFGANHKLQLNRNHNDNSFTSISKNVRKDIFVTYEKLAKLKLLMQSKQSKADDNAKLVAIIKQDISFSTIQLTKLQQIIKSYKMNHHYLAHSNSAILSMQSMLGNISTELKTLLELRHQSMIKENESRTQFEDYNNSNWQSNKPEMKQSNYNSSKFYKNSIDDKNKLPGNYYRLMNQDQLGQKSSNRSFDQNYNRDYNSAQQRSSYSDQQSRYTAQQQDQMLRHRAAPQRLDEMKGLEQTIVELGDIFQQLAQMVQDQEHVVNRIDSHIDMTELNVEAAHGELAKYLHYISGNRAFYLKIFLVLLLTFVSIIYILK